MKWIALASVAVLIYGLAANPLLAFVGTGLLLLAASVGIAKRL